MSSLVPENLGSDTNNLIQQVLEQTNAMYLPFWIQIGCVVAAIALGWFVALRVGTVIKIFSINWNGNSLTHRGVRFGLDLLRRLLLSVFSGVFLFTIVYIIKEIGILANSVNLHTLTLAYRAFYAWAVFVVIVECLAVLFDGQRMHPKIKNFFYIGFWSLAFLQIFGILTPIVAEMKSISLPLGSEKLTLWTLLVGFLTILLALAFANWLSNVVEVSVKNAKDIDDNLKIVLARLTRIAFFALAILTSLSSAGIDLTVLSIFGGAVGVGLGFGLQKIASNYISGFIILFDHSINIGDLVEVNGFSGKISQINTRYSVIRNLRGEEMVIPNECFVTEKIMNYSRTDRSLVTSVDVSIDYEDDVTRAMAIMVDIVKTQPRLVPSRSPTAFVTGFGNDGIDLRVNFWVIDPENGTSVLKSNIMRQILIRFAEENISIPYQVRDVRLTGELRVKTPETEGTIKTTSN